MGKIRRVSYITDNPEKLQESQIILEFFPNFPLP